MERRKKSRQNEPQGNLFGAKLQEIRKKKGLTQAKLAERMGVPFRVITYYENEAKNPSLNFIEKAAEALEVPKALLLGIEAKAEFQEVPDVIKALKVRIPKLSALPRKDQESLVSLLDGLFMKNHIE